MRRKLLLLAIATVLACVTAATGLAAGSTQVTHFSFTTPSNVCGISGTAVGHGTSVFRDTGNGTYFMSGNFVRRLHGRQWKINHALLRRAGQSKRRRP